MREGGREGGMVGLLIGWLFYYTGGENRTVSLNIVGILNCGYNWLCKLLMIAGVVPSY